MTNAIIKATNWQTEITEEQLFALQQFPKTLEAFFASYPLANRLYFERRSRQYDGQAIEKTRVVTFVGLIRAFGAMFLNEPHRATRNYKALKARVGKDIFAKDQKMELYYVSALALYRIEFLFRTKRLEAKYKPARYHILTAVRILIAGFEMPTFTANKMETYCKTLSEVLQDQGKSEEYVSSAARIVETAAAGNFHRDNIRTERFTEKVIELAKADQPKAIAANAD